MSGHPLLLQAGIRTTSRSPFDLDQLGDEAPDFRHLVYGSRPHGSIRLGLECASGPADDARSVDVTVQNIDEWQDQVVRQLTVTSGFRHNDIDLVWTSTSSKSTSPTRAPES